jgi:cytochrome c peroxidase
MRLNKKILFIAGLCAVTISMQSFIQREHAHDDEKAVNLKVLPKDIPDEELHKIMRGYSLSLGVHCNYCHVAHDVPGQQRPKMDFASDDKPEKLLSRDMMRMTASINADYISKMTGIGHNMQQVTCVTCHNGRALPLATTDSLPQHHDMPPQH